MYSKTSVGNKYLSELIDLVVIKYFAEIRINKNGRKSFCYPNNLRLNIFSSS